jgi:hypothetical protein
VKLTTVIITNCFLIIAFLLATPRSASSSPANQALVQADHQGFWRLDKVSTKNTDVQLEPGQVFSASDGFVSASTPFVTKVDYGGDTTGTREGTNSWTSPPLNLYPGIQYTTNLGATSNVTAVNGNANSTHQTDLWLGNEKIGSVKAFSEANTGGSDHNTGEVTEMKTFTWTIEAGTYDGQRYGITIAAGTCLGFTVAYTYEYVWQPTGINELIPTQETQATLTLTPEVQRELTVTGYDGSDTLHTPLTFLIQARENDKPLANEPVYFQFGGDVNCLADLYAIWDEASNSWMPESVNLAWAINENKIQTTTDNKGQVIIRVLLDFSRMHLKSISLPCAETLKVEVAKQAGDQANRVTAENTVTIRYPLYIQNVFFWAEKDPQPPSRWIRLGMIDNEYSGDVITKNYNGRSKPGYPETYRILERVKVNGQAFQPPVNNRDYFSPISAGDTLEVDLCNNTGNYYAEMLPEDGIAVSVMWMDGTQGVFAQRHQDREMGCILVVKFDPEGTRSVETNDPNTFNSFMVGQVGDFVIHTALFIGVTWGVGPVAGGLTAYLVDSVQTVGDINDLYKLGRGDYRMRTIVFRSEASVTTAKDGLTTLYNFEGSPAVIDDAGNEVVAVPGEAIDFRLTGAVSVAEKRDPPEEVSALQTLIAHEPGFTARPFDELVLSGKTTTDQNSSKGLQNRVWVICCCCAILLAFGIGLVVVLLIIRRRTSLLSREGS